MPTVIPFTTLKKRPNRSNADHKTMRVRANRENSVEEMEPCQNLGAATLLTYTKSCDDDHNDEM